MKTGVDWETQAKGIIRAELKRHNLSYANLAERLETLGIQETPRNIQNKITRGGFKVIFLLQVMRAIGVKHLRLSSDE